ncbi:hypothetical protein EEL50_07955 [Muribaculaceae bacterium Isolate-105 (HZI)]|uniref:hypothetical protein n=1 Tax=Paramuribaculum intestinale TaxID=2094151 RepID=UPI000F4ACB1E|nr:hypothetical protein [Paramuribaculum intestinale]ROT14406.1 hypothetical protein EEL50_07955 [Muribaculaceae bacterium Isolate-105 (HZI)]
MEEKTIVATQESAYRPPRKPTLPEFGPGVQIPASRPIAPTLKMLKIGESAEFPIEQLTSVQSTKNRLCRMYARQGWNADVVVNDLQYQVIVTRTA